MKGHVYQRGKTWGYIFDVDPDPLTGKRRQQTRGGFGSEREAWKECRAAIKEYEDGHHVKPSKRKVEDAFSEWLKRIQHSVKPSMWASYRNYAQYYVIPYIGRRAVQDLDGATFDALYDHLLTNGRVKARPERRKPLEDKAAARERAIADRAAGKRRRGPVPKPRPLVPAPPPGLAPKTVVNTHRMLHKAWEDFVMWGWAKRNVVKDAHVPRVPRWRPSTWNVEQLQRFLAHARGDRFFALWVLEATSGVRRSELAGARRDGIDRVAGSLSFDVTRVVVDGKVLESDGKTENAQRVVALDPLTLAVLHDWVKVLDAERRALGDAYHDHGVLFCWPDGRPPHPDTITARFKRLVKEAGLPMIRLHDVRHSYATLGRDAGVNWKTLSRRIGHSDVAFTMRQYVHTDLEADHVVARALAELILSDALLAHPADGDLVSKSVSTDEENAR